MVSIFQKRSYRITKMTTNTEKKIKEQIKTDFEEPNLGMIMPRKNKKKRDWLWRIKPWKDSVLNDQHGQLYTCKQKIDSKGLDTNVLLSSFWLFGLRRRLHMAIALCLTRSLYWLRPWLCCSDSACSLMVCSRPRVRGLDHI